ncbi:hypothetical protein [Soonwooa sp.]|uniref:hypothetical protein n=1 Tax=Soonwooa sp. TaxID=1938592 RepID=UPI0028AADABE|nr:hypothetical protein [Soonwooa sp.]
MTEIESLYKHKALEMAIADFDSFCKYAGVNSQQLMVCIERDRGLSYGQISQKLRIPKSTVIGICDRCFATPSKSDKRETKEET